MSYGCVYLSHIQYTHMAKVVTSTVVCTVVLTHSVFLHLYDQCGESADDLESHAYVREREREKKERGDTR